MLLRFASSFSLSSHCLPILLSGVVALTVCGPVRAEPPAPSVTTTIKPIKGGGFVVNKTETTTIAGIKFFVNKTETMTIAGVKNVDVAMQQNLKMVPELVEEAAVLTKFSGQSVVALMAVWHIQRTLGDSEGAKNTLIRALPRSGVSSYANRFYPFSIIVEAQKKDGDTEGVKNTLAAAQQIVSPVEGSVESSTFGDIAQAQAQAGDTEGAKRTLAIAVQKAVGTGREHSQDLFIIAKSQANIGDIAGAKTTADTIEDAYEKNRALCAIAEAQARSGDTTSAKATLTTAKQVADTIKDTSRKNYALYDTVEAQANTGDIAGAKKTYAEIPDSADYKVSRLRYIVEAQAKAGDLAGAKTTADAIPNDDEYTKAIALTAIAVAQAKAGDNNGAKANFTKARSFAESGRQMDGPGDSPYKIAAAQAQAGYFTDAKRTTDKIADARQKADALATLASAILDAAIKQADAAKK